jgi:hypothetical protein
LVIVLTLDLEEEFNFSFSNKLETVTIGLKANLANQIQLETIYYAAYAIREPMLRQNYTHGKKEIMGTKYQKFRILKQKNGV